MNHVIYEIPGHLLLTPWKLIGMTGALLFSLRWLVQFYYSRKAGVPVTPRSFWIMSIIGSLMTLAYFLFSPKRDMVGIIQNIFPSVIASYNLYLELTRDERMRRQSEQASLPRISKRLQAIKEEPA